MAQAATWPGTDAEARKRGERTGLDTRVVHAVNDVDSGCGLPLRRLCPQVHTQVDRLGTTSASLKLKGIDGGPHKQRSVWFNSTQHEEPYPGWTWTCTLVKASSFEGSPQVLHGCRQLVS